MINSCPQSYPQNADKSLSERLERIYRDYNKREFVSPDPLQFLYGYGDPLDIEVVGLIASSLAYGRVASILASVSRVLDVLGTSPALAVADMPEAHIASALDGFAHRFVKGPEMAAFLAGVGRVIGARGTLEAAFSAHRGTARGRAGTLEAMDGFADEIVRAAGLEATHLLPRASKGSACKRLALFLRWVSRHDDVDLGIWRSLLPDEIIVPLDTHMFHIASGLGLTRRRSADGRTAVEITDGFAAICPTDPIRYDFALTRFGIRNELSVDELLDALKK